MLNPDALTHDEIVEMFGEWMPIEAVALIQEHVGTADELRSKLRALTKARTPAEKWRCVNCGRMTDQHECDLEHCKHLSTPVHDEGSQ